MNDDSNVLRIEDDNMHMRVYVNNMNTRHATVTLPTRHRSMNHESFNPRRDGSGESGGDQCDTEIDRRKKGFSAQPAMFGPHHGSSTTTKTELEDATLASIASRNSDMERIYQRIMWRLQREINYEIKRVPLAEQYGVHLDEEDPTWEKTGKFLITTSKEGGGEREGEFAVASASAATSGLEGDHNRAIAKPASECTSDAEQNRSTLPSMLHVGTLSNLRNECPVRYRSDALNPLDRRETLTVGNAQGRSPEKHNVSRIVQYQTSTVNTRPSTQTPAALLATLGGTSSAETAVAIEEEDRALALQPCPRTLRLVIQHVQKTLANKMDLAERGSLEDFLRFTFESRALLDRLLREAHLYSPFPSPEQMASGKMPISKKEGSQGGASKVGSPLPKARTGGRAVRLNELFQKFIKQPVLLPHGRYTQDPGTGAVSAELSSSYMEQLWQKKSSSASLLRLSKQSNGLNASWAPTSLGLQLPNVDHSPQKTTEVDVGGGGTVQSFTTPEELSTGSDVAFDTRLVPTYGLSTRLEQGSRNANELQMGVEGLNGTVFPNGKSTILSTATHFTMSMAPLENEASGYGTSVRARHVAPYTIAKHMVSVATMTEVSDETQFVSLAQYKKAEERIAELEVMLIEQQRTNLSFTEELRKVNAYSERKAQVIKYLRETLVRECNLLRTELCFASQRERELQHALRDARAAATATTDLQMYSNTAGENYAFGASLPGAAQTSSPFLRASSNRSVSPLSNHTALAATTGTRVGSSDTKLLPLGGGVAPAGSNPANGGGESAAPMTDNAAIRSSTAMQHGIGSRSRHLSIATSHYLMSPRLGENSLACLPNGAVLTPLNAPLQQGSALPPTTAQDLECIQSLLDLVLLAVEQDKTFAIPASKLKAAISGLETPQQLESVVEKNVQQQVDRLRAEYEEKQRTMKDLLISQNLMHNHVVASQNCEIARIRKLFNLGVVQTTIGEGVKKLRGDLRHLRNDVQICLQDFKVSMGISIAAMQNRVQLFDEALHDAFMLETSLEAAKYLIESGYALFSPMLTEEYVRGYHPWPLRLRNTCDPFSHIIQVRFGTQEVVRLRESIDTLDALYLEVHKFVSKTIIVPEPVRPMCGKTLRFLCAAIALNPLTSLEPLFEVRHRYSQENIMCRNIALINIKLLWNIYLQHTYSARSISAIAESGMDPHTTTLPIAARVNQLATRRRELIQERNTIQKERLENARNLYRLWQERQIDIFEGYAPPSLNISRGLALLNNASIGNGGVRDLIPSDKMRNKTKSCPAFLREPRNASVSIESDLLHGYDNVKARFDQASLISLEQKDRLEREEEERSSSQKHLIQLPPLLTRAGTEAMVSHSKGESGCSHGILSNVTAISRNQTLASTLSLHSNPSHSSKGDGGGGGGHPLDPRLQNRVANFPESGLLSPTAETQNSPLHMRSLVFSTYINDLIRSTKSSLEITPLSNSMNKTK